MREIPTPNERPEVTALRSLFGRLRLGYVSKFNSSQDGSASEVLPRDTLVDANVVRSDYREGGMDRGHALLLDIDHPAWLVRSSTPGHYHLYIEVPGGIPHAAYLSLLGALGRAGVIERGYVKTSRIRGFTTLRLPWIKKEENDAEPQQP